jgi:hypothetical protein
MNTRGEVMRILLIYLSINLSSIQEVQTAQRLYTPATTPGVTVTVVQDEVGDKRHVETQYQRLYYISGNWHCNIRSATHTLVEKEQKRIAQQVGTCVERMTHAIKQYHDKQSCTQQQETAERLIAQQKLLSYMYLTACDHIIKPLLAHWFYMMKRKEAETEHGCLPYVALHVCNNLTTPASTAFLTASYKDDTRRYYYPILYINTPSVGHESHAHAIPPTPSFYAEMSYVFSHEFSHLISYDPLNMPLLFYDQQCREHQADRLSTLFMRSGSQRDGPIAFFSRLYVYQKIYNECYRMILYNDYQKEKTLGAKIKYQWKLNSAALKNVCATHPCSLVRIRNYLVHFADSEHNELFGDQEVSDEVRSLRARSLQRWARNLVTQTVGDVTHALSKIAQDYDFDSKPILEQSCKDIMTVIHKASYGNAPVPDLYKKSRSFSEIMTPHASLSISDIAAVVGKLCALNHKN